MFVRSRFVALALSALCAVTTASATVTGLTNGNFEAQQPGDGSDIQSITSWFESATPSNGSGYQDWLFRTSSQFNSLNTTTVLGFSILSTSYVYQQIGTYTANEMVMVNGQVLQRTVSQNDGFKLELLAGNFGGAADGTPLTATLLATATFDRTTLTGAPYNFGGTGSTAYMANFSASLDSGTSGVGGTQLWLRVSPLNTGGGEVFLDNLSVSAVPEPSTYAALTGLAMFGFVAWKRRRLVMAGAK